MTKDELKREETRKRNEVARKVIDVISRLESKGYDQKTIRDGIKLANRVRLGAA